MTEKEKVAAIRKLMRIAGQLYVARANSKLPEKAREELFDAHDAVCKAADILERE